MSAGQRELQGWWWRPNDPEARRPGTLRLDVESGVTLELLGGFSITTEETLPGGVIQRTPADDPFPILHGESLDEPVTLVGCVPIGTRAGFFGGDIGSQTVTANRAYLGIHLGSVDEPVFSRAAFELEYLLGWSWAPGLPLVQTEGPAPSDGIDLIAPRTASVGPLEITLEHLKNESVRHRQRLSARAHARTEWARVTVVSDAAQSVSAFDAVVKALMDLITIAAQAPAGVIGQLVLTAGDDGRGDGSRVEVHGKDTHLVKPDEGDDDERYVRYLFTLADAPWQELIPRWMQLHSQCRFPISMLAGLFYSPGGYSDVQLLITAAAAEGLHRELHDKAPLSEAKFTDLRRRIKGAIVRADRSYVFQRLHNQMSFRERLLNLLTIPDHQAVQQLIQDPAQWADLIRDARNGVAHALKPERTEDGHTLVFHARTATRGLISVFLMHELALSEEAQRQAASHPSFVWSARQLHEGLDRPNRTSSDGQAP